jgi:hypothetical protein
MSIKRIINDGSLRNTIGDKVSQTDPRLSDQRTPSDNSVTSAKIVDGAIVNADVNNSAAIAQSKIANLTADLGSKLDLAGGKILQIVRTTDVTARATSSTSYVDVTGMSVTITPQKSNSAILVLANALIVARSQTDTISGNFAITDASNNAISGAEFAQIGTLNVTGTSVRNHNEPLTIFGYATPATLLPVTYKLRFAMAVGSFDIIARNSTQTGQMYAIEISA